ncbi:MAG TPA: hypothetical protein VGE52_18390 [Pirellulales bacterium]
MDVVQAKELIWYEACESGGVVLTLRMGDDPGVERMRKLLLALKIVFDDLHEATAIDRPLAYALHALAVYPESQASAWSRQGRTWRTHLIADEIPAVALAAESIFAGEWQDLSDEPGPAGTSACLKAIEPEPPPS